MSAPFCSIIINNIKRSIIFIKNKKLTYNK